MCTLPELSGQNELNINLFVTSTYYTTPKYYFIYLIPQLTRYTYTYLIEEQKNLIDFAIQSTIITLYVKIKK